MSIRQLDIKKTWISKTILKGYGRYFKDFYM